MIRNERHALIIVGTSYKLAPAGGNHPRYEEYKNGLQTFIKEDFLEPRYEKEAPLYQQGFDYLITHLENEPNPFYK